MKKTLLTFIIVLAIILTAAICLTACGDPTLTKIVVSVDNTEYDSSYSFGKLKAGDAPNLTYKIYAKYSDDSKKELTSSDYTTVYKLNDETIEALPSALESGEYTILITYKDFNLTLSFSVDAASKTYQTVLVGKTQWAYGEEQPEIKLSDNSVSVGENDLYCIEKSKVANPNNLTLEEFDSATLYNKEFTLDPGEYYLFIKVPQTGNFAATYSSLKEIKVTKATPKVVNAASLRATYTYYAPVFGKIKSENLSFKEEGPAVKLGAEDFQALTWKFENKDLDSANNGETIKLLFTLEAGYEKYYNTPTSVDVPLEINKASIDKPTIAEHGYTIVEEHLIDIYVGDQSAGIGFDWQACNLTMTKPDSATEKIDISDENSTHILLERQTKAGTYIYKISLVDKVNYSWSDNTTDDVTKEIVIAGDDLTGKTTAFSNLRLLDAAGKEITDDGNEYAAMTESIRSSNLGLVDPETGNPVNPDDAIPATAKAETNGTVSGTCDFGGGTFDKLITDGEPFYYTYDANRANTVEMFVKNQEYDVVIEESKLVGNLVGDTLTLTMKIYTTDEYDQPVDTGFIWEFTFTLIETQN